VAALEVRLRGPLREAAWRVCVSLPTGHEHGEEHVDVYREAVPPAAVQAAAASGTATAGQQRVYQAVLAHQPGASVPSQPGLGGHSVSQSGAGSGGAGKAPLHGTLVSGPYPGLEPLQQRRLAARRHNVT
jgi:hypothetical protein